MEYEVMEVMSDFDSSSPIEQVSHEEPALSLPSCVKIKQWDVPQPAGVICVLLCLQVATLWFVSQRDPLSRGAEPLPSENSS